MTQSLEVWLDSDVVPMTLIGRLSSDRGNLWFDYAPAWLDNVHRFELDPDLTLGEGAFHPDPDAGNFGIFLDSAPDRWGQTLMKRREALSAKDEERRARTMYAWDFLIGVQDFTRQGALRFRLEGKEEFLGAERYAAPPVTSLGELETVARELTSKRIEDLDALRRWLAVLVAPGASLGGARPKANFTEADGSLWIAKFPSRDDDRDIGAWEFVVRRLADRAHVDVPPAKLARYNSDFHTYCSRRFDRAAGQRRFYASAMTLLRKNESEGTSYLELAQFLRQAGSPPHVADDLKQLFRRVLFNVAVGNRDDHLRNHGFVLAEQGWRPSPAFDVNPNIDKAEHVLNLDDSDNRPSIAVVMTTAEFYGLTASQATQIRDEILPIADEWVEEARAAGISSADIATTAQAFETR